MTQSDGEFLQDRCVFGCCHAPNEIFVYDCSSFITLPPSVQGALPYISQPQLFLRFKLHKFEWVAVLHRSSPQKHGDRKADGSRIEV